MTSAPPPPGDQTAGPGPARSNAELAADVLQRASRGRAAEDLGGVRVVGLPASQPVLRGRWPITRLGDGSERPENPDKVLEVKRTISEGPLVAVHSFVRPGPGGRGAALVHIFRIEDARIRELWDIGQNVPADSRNQSGMF